MNKIITKYLQQIDKNNVKFIYLTGSYARNKETIFSDIDLKIFVKDGDSRFETGYFEGVYITCRYESLKDQDEYFTNPREYLYMKETMKHLVVLYDEDNHFKDFKQKFDEIKYHSHFEKQIIDYVNKEVVDWFEEINKSLNGLYLKNDEKLLAGLFGLTYGMLTVLSISEGISYSPDGLLVTYKKYFNKEIYKYVERAFGVVKHSLKTRTLYGFKLYLEISLIIKKHLTNETQTQLDIVKKNIIKALHNY